MKYWNACEEMSSLESGSEPTWRLRYSFSASCGSMVIAHSPSASSVSCGPTPSRRKAREIRSCSASSQRMVRLPRAAARSASEAATVLLPTPPLPVTKIIVLSSSAGMMRV